MALASRDLTWPAGKLAQARVVLEQCGDTLNAAQARYVEIRWLVLAGRLAEAQRQLAALPAAASPALAVMHELLLAHIAMRQQRAREARSALQRAMRNAVRAGIPALVAEVAAAQDLLRAPVAKLLRCGRARTALDPRSRAGNHDRVVTPCATGGALAWAA